MRVYLSSQARLTSYHSVTRSDVDLRRLGFKYKRLRSFRSRAAASHQ